MWNQYLVPAYFLSFSMPLVLLKMRLLLVPQEREMQEEELKMKEAELIRGNPLLNNPTSFNVKRRLVIQILPPFLVGVVFL